MLAPEGIRVSPITNPTIPHEQDSGIGVDRWLVLEQRNGEKSIKITTVPAAFLDKLNPSFPVRHVESGALGQLLSANTFFAGVQLASHVSNQSKAAVVVLQNAVEPFEALQADLDIWLSAAASDIVDRGGTTIETVMSFARQIQSCVWARQHRSLWSAASDKHVTTLWPK